MFELKRLKKLVVVFKLQIQNVDVLKSINCVTNVTTQKLNSHGVS